MTNIYIFKKIPSLFLYQYFISNVLNYFTIRGVVGSETSNNYNSHKAYISALATTWGKKNFLSVINLFSD